MIVIFSFFLIFLGGVGVVGGFVPCVTWTFCIRQSSGCSLCRRLSGRGGKITFLSGSSSASGKK